MDFERARKELLPYFIGFSASAVAVLSLLAAIPPQAPSPSLMGKLKTAHLVPLSRANPKPSLITRDHNLLLGPYDPRPLS